MIGGNLLISWDTQVLYEYDKLPVKSIPLLKTIKYIVNTLTFPHLSLTLMKAHKGLVVQSQSMSCSTTQFLSIAAKKTSRTAVVLVKPCLSDAKRHCKLAKSHSEEIYIHFPSPTRPV